VTKARPVVITTQHRGVFFGYMAKPLGEDKTASLTKARNCLYWTADVQGFMGLASGGPKNGCRVGPVVTEILLTDVTSVISVTADAEKRWNDAPW